MTRILVVILVVVSLALGLTSTERAPASAQPGVVITVLEPKEGANVGRETTVRGTAKLGTGLYLWVFARREDFRPLVWPQREAVIDFKDNSWKATAAFGAPEDVGWNFDVVIAAFDATGHAEIMAYWVAAMRSGDWKPISMPAPVAPPHFIKVKKVSHAPSRP